VLAGPGQAGPLHRKSAPWRGCELTPARRERGGPTALWRFNVAETPTSPVDRLPVAVRFAGIGASSATRVRRIRHAQRPGLEELRLLAEKRSEHRSPSETGDRWQPGSRAC